MIVTNLNGNLNASSVDGLNSLMRLNGTYTINQDFPVTDRGTLNLLGNWTKSANIDASGTIIFDYATAGPSPFITIRNEIISGFNGGAWNGSGIRSSAAAADPDRGVGYAESSDVLGMSGGTFLGESVDGTAVLVRYTRYGDANLDGQVNLGDFNRLAANFGQSDRHWSQGDFTYDGVVNLADFNRLAANFGLSAGSAAMVPFGRGDDAAHASLNDAQELLT
jgi:hypothetical protein